MVDYKKQGKKNRATGKAFELRVRKDLEEQGYIVDRWTNNVELSGSSKTYAIRADSQSVLIDHILKSFVPTEHSEFLNINCSCGFKYVCDSLEELPKNSVKCICGNMIIKYETDDLDADDKRIAKLIPAKSKWNNFTKSMMMGSGGFPDYIAFKKELCVYEGLRYNIIGVECKVNGRLDKEEKEKCDWLLKNKIFNKILIASKDKIKNRIIIKYERYEPK